MKNFNRTFGFSLIELMIVIAIIGILATIAVPSYKNYIIKTRITEVIILLEANKTVIEEYIAVNGKVPVAGSSIVPETNYSATTSKWVTTWGYEGVWGVTALLDTTALGITTTGPHKIYLRPHKIGTSDQIQWICSTFISATWPYLPTGCQNGDPNPSEWPAG